MDFRGQASIKLKTVRRIGNVEFRFRQRLAAIGHFQLGQPFGLATNSLGHLEKEICRDPRPKSFATDRYQKLFAPLSTASMTSSRFDSCTLAISSPLAGSRSSRS